MRILDLIWDEWNEEHIARHGVNRDEATEVTLNDPYITRARHRRYRLIGPTDGGRLLMVIVVPRPGGRYYVVTARDADDDERRAYRRR